MYVIEISWSSTDAEGNTKYHSVRTDKVTVTIDQEGTAWYECKQIITGKAFRVSKDDSWMGTAYLEIGT